MNEIIPSDSGYSIQTDDRTIFFANAELQNVGCMNCVWKLHGQCPHNIGDDDCYVEKDIVETDNNGNVKSQKPIGSVAICPEMILFITSLAEKGDSITAIWEKFLIYKLRIQESIDYKDYMLLKKKIHDVIKDGSLSEDALDKLQMDKTAAKIWWSKLNEHAITSTQKIVDREIKKDIGKKGAGIYSAHTINFGQVIQQNQVENKK